MFPTVEQSSKALLLRKRRNHFLFCLHGNGKHPCLAWHLPDTPVIRCAPALPWALPANRASSFSFPLPTGFHTPGTEKHTILGTPLKMRKLSVLRNTCSVQSLPQNEILGVLGGKIVSVLYVQSTDACREHEQVWHTSVVSKLHGRVGVGEAILKVNVPRASKCPKGRDKEVIMQGRYGSPGPWKPDNMGKKRRLCAIWPSVCRTP